MISRFRVLLFVPFALFGSLTNAQTIPEKESLKVKVLKVERIQDDQEGNLWYKIKIVFRDNNGRLYHVWAACITTNPDSPVSCGSFVVPRAGLTYDGLNYGDISFQFSGSKAFYEITSVEVSDCK